MNDIKVTVAQMKLELALSAPRIPALSTFTPVAFWELIFQELERLWAIEEATVSLREAQNAYDKRMSGWVIDVTLAGMIDDARVALFDSLPPREPSGGEEGKP